MAAPARTEVPNQSATQRAQQATSVGSTQPRGIQGSNAAAAGPQSFAETLNSIDPVLVWQAAGMDADGGAGGSSPAGPGGPEPGGPPTASSASADVPPGEEGEGFQN
ncbi:MAG: hypothetical protein KI785_09705, partial [Devosiaceae bacterium]|nr:hypothetical protein [Devosiaceae bacterium MH13]